MSDDKVIRDHVLKLLKGRQGHVDTVPSAVVPLAVLLEQKVNLAGRKVGIILSGGNVDLEACLNHSLDDA